MIEPLRRLKPGNDGEKIAETTLIVSSETGRCRNLRSTPSSFGAVLTLNRVVVE